jgi:hypothetical protein
MLTFSHNRSNCTMARLQTSNWKISCPSRPPYAPRTSHTVLYSTYKLASQFLHQGIDCSHEYSSMFHVQLLHYLGSPLVQRFKVHVHVSRNLLLFQLLAQGSSPRYKGIWSSAHCTSTHSMGLMWTKCEKWQHWWVIANSMNPDVLPNASVQFGSLL